MNNENLTFITASQAISLDSGGTRYGFVPETDPLLVFYGGFLYTDFAGMNHHIYEPVSSSANMLGYESSVTSSNNLTNYVNSNVVNLGTFGGAETHPSNNQLYHIILHRQGPYGWPTWKQVRTGNHPIVRYWKKNNVFSYAQKSSTGKTKAAFPYNINKEKSADIIFQKVVPPLTARYKSLDHSFVVKQDNKQVNLLLRHSYGNIKTHYSNEKINFRLIHPDSFKEDINVIYDDLERIYITKDFAEDADANNPFGKQVPFKKWLGFIYSENIFPKESNAYLARTRRRTQYAEVAGTGPNGYDRRDFRTFWKDNLEDRDSRTPHVAFNNMGYPTHYQQSFWSLDTGGTTPGNRQGNAVGQLLFPLSLGSTSGYTAVRNTGSLSLYRFPTNVAATPVDRYLYGIPFYATDQISGKKPFFNSYEDFVEDIRGLGKDYSILPEFRISDHMDYYIKDKEGNFLARNDEFLSMVGGNITSSAEEPYHTTGERSTLYDPTTRDSGFNSNFFVEYSHSDFLKYFQKFKLDHQQDGEVKNYAFTIKGIKKLLPYRGFYPHQRALQLGTILSQSYGENLTGSNKTITSLAETESLSAFLRPLASPGIMFNSLKSAIAVDYPVFTGSASNLNAQQDSTFTQLNYWNVQQNYRLPFETIIQPEVYLPTLRQADVESGNYIEKIINFDEPSGIGTPDFLFGFGLFGGGDSRYSLAANNFFGEIPRFFLKDQRLTDFVSQPESLFEEVTAGKSYYMDVIIRKSSDMVLSEGQYDDAGGSYNFSLTKGAYYGPPVSSAVADAVGSNVRDPAYAPYTPPYFYEDSIARIKYTPTTGGKPTLGDILSNAEINTEYTGSSVELGLDGFASKTKMTISASVNLFGRSRYKKANFDASPTGIGPDGKYIPTTMEDTDSTAFDAWSIGTKFECPALNFSGSTDFHSASTGRGLWGGYGSLPTGSTGVWLDLKESFQFRSATAIDDSLTGSLIDICGFRSTEKKIGKLATEKVISEAVVAIPFTWTDEVMTKDHDQTVFNGRRFFNIKQEIFNESLQDSGEGKSPSDAASFSVTDMINKMQKYNLPPQFDFITFESIKPFVMYIFEFEHTLTQQDLSDIWQGLMPEISLRAELQEASIIHKAGEKEFFGKYPIPAKTRWMLFKVKRKAEKSYFSVTADSEDDQRFKFQFGNQEKPPEYNYNWPYDFFSLVELAKMEGNIEFAPKTIAVQTGFVIAGEGE